MPTSITELVIAELVIANPARAVIAGKLNTLYGRSKSHNYVAFSPNHFSDRPYPMRQHQPRHG
ncbi:hypothetical protein [Dasania marina]|uniref:hypothetical protein n=1 Tax=Dasania marina TaxID=471499 RepID=UPI000376B21C|nr:hypothetical protein [Dasania marina]